MNDLSLYSGAFTLGFLGSLHCAGMCGPLVLAVHSKCNSPILLNTIIYHSGRIWSYSFLGLLMFFLGNSVTIFISQKYFSVILGIGMLIFYFIIPKFKLLKYSQLFSSIYSKFQNQNRNTVSSFVLGILNGFIPCGLVYAGLILSLSNQNLQQCIGTMITFGLGTLPMMLSISTSTRWLKINYKHKLMKYITSSAIIFTAVFLISKGYVQEEQLNATNCSHCLSGH